ncbi:MAG: ABC transporter substrate-binding protein [Legionellales bacterium]|jgi:ABC-type transport system substrate-binding protein
MKGIGRSLSTALLLLFSIFLLGCNDPWNNPYPEDKPTASVYYTDFSERPKYLDPAKSYASAESEFIGQIYESPLQYNYLLRPYTLEPNIAAKMPIVKYYNAQDQLLSDTATPDQIAYSIYEISIIPGVLYQPHPAFAENDLSEKALRHIHILSDFPKTGTREVIAEDFVYQIKRLANPFVNSPILDLMGQHIAGLKDFSDRLALDATIDLRTVDFEGAKVIDRYTYQIRINKKYPQFMYWLAMLFFSPMPWEAEAFYAHPELIKKNISLNWYPVGTGPYVLTVNNPNRQMILEKNPNFRKQYYPSVGMPGDLEAGLLKNAGKQIPMVDKIVFSLEKEAIPRWIKFLQGYYDRSVVGTDNYNQAIVTTGQGSVLAPLLANKGMEIYSDTSEMTSYWGFNMLDPIVGGNDEKRRALRQAISIAMDVEEYIAIFLNDRGTVAQSPIPPGIEGYQVGKAGMNPYVYRWENNQAKRLSLDYAKQLLAKAGYPNGRHAQTGEPLVLNYDVISTGDPAEKAEFAWVQKQFNKLNIELNIRATDFNRWREKMSLGDGQFFSFAWSVDYPDPENFLFLLYGSNKRVGNEGVNSANYENAEFDKLFEQLRYLDSGPLKTAVINKMIAIIQNDAPWVFGFHPQIYILSQAWNAPIKISEVANNTFKYRDVDPVLRNQLREAWNKPIIWPFFVIIFILIILIVPIALVYWRYDHQARHKRI